MLLNILGFTTKREKKIKPVKGDFNEDKQLKGADKQLEGADKQLKGANKQLEGNDKQLEGADKQLEGADKQLEGNNKQLEGNNKQLEGNNKRLEGDDKQLKGADKQLEGADKQPEGADKQPEGKDKQLGGDGVKTASVSDKIKKFNCMYCDKSFTRNANLRDHIVLHTGEKNLKCSVCLKAFLTRTKFVKHKEECEFENPGEICKIMRLNGKNLSKEPLNQDNNHEKKVQEDKGNDIDGGPDNLNSCTEVNMPNGEENILGSQGIIRNDSDAKKNDVGNSQRAENMFDFGNILNDLSNFLSERMFDTDLNVS
ncbi:zinc finger and SCAN domain-containing protein 12-like [Ruditapes philippinarum]|uniref:zinc finger and SCAN domain-containing protein 12-like n=1 Tax=Ruditapes philippinarum TaxID=129788 RepID=UPI00295BBE70|nr:zinc finger and SCAN domain-containing protein 12-like [Ruditapes philippinarum]